MAYGNLRFLVAYQKFIAGSLHSVALLVLL